jgi:hypothetical protein
MYARPRRHLPVHRLDYEQSPSAGKHEGLMQGLTVCITPGRPRLVRLRALSEGSSDPSGSMLGSKRTVDHAYSTFSNCDRRKRSARCAIRTTATDLQHDHVRKITFTSLTALGPIRLCAALIDKLVRMSWVWKVAIRLHVWTAVNGLLHLSIAFGT